LIGGSPYTGRGNVTDKKRVRHDDIRIRYRYVLSSRVHDVPLAVSA